MIDVDLQGGQGVASLPAELQGLAAPLAGVAAQEYTESVFDWIRSGRAFTSREGAVEQGIGWIAKASQGTEVFSQHRASGALEYGSKPHVIRPRPGRKALKIPVPDSRGYILRRQINHPGTQPTPFFFADLAKRKERMAGAMLRFAAEQLGGEA